MSGSSPPVRTEVFWEDLRYGPDGLVPVVVQSALDGRVLMLAYANREAARRTASERRAWFWSRSRGELWRKGDTSGNALDVLEVRWDCDGDALLYVARPHGPACHTGATSCFHRGEERAPAAEAVPPQCDGAEEPAGTLGTVLDGLTRVVAARRREMPAGSYVAGVLRAGPARALQKVGEEAVEVAIAGMAAVADASGGDRVRASQSAAVGEFADLFFHGLVALAVLGIPPEAVAAELAARHRLRPARGQPPHWQGLGQGGDS